jgi:hypothetical protein
MLRLEILMKTNATITQTSTRSRTLFRQDSNTLLPRFVALIAIFAILIPTLFIIPAAKVSAKEAVSSYVAASPEAFVIGDGQLAVGSWQLAVGSWQLAV